MKKFLLIFFTFILMISCEKKKPVIGNRKDIFLNNNIITINGNKSKIIVNPPSTFNNYYGISSTLNEKIENYSVKNLDFNQLNIATKKFGVKNYFFSSPIIVNSITYYLDTNGNLIAKNLKDTKNNILWKTKIIDRNNFINYYGGKISYYNDTIFITTRLNEVIAVGIDGTLQWKKSLNSIPISAPVIDGNSVFVITNDNKLYSLDTEDGKIQWISYGTSKDSAILGSANPVIYKNFIIASYSSGELFILNKNTGETVFNMNLIGRYNIFSSFELTDIDTTPVIKNEILVATANNGITVAIDLKTMKVLWKQNLASLTNILINNNFVYLITTNNTILCLNLEDGKINWFTDLDQYFNIEKKKSIIFYKSLVFINSKLYAFNNMNQYKILNPYDGKLLNSNSLSFLFFTTPFSLGNKIYGIATIGNKILFI